MMGSGTRAHASGGEQCGGEIPLFRVGNLGRRDSESVAEPSRGLLRQVAKIRLNFFHKVVHRCARWVIVWPVHAGVQQDALVVHAAPGNGTPGTTLLVPLLLDPRRE